jgi:hypothetical protein
VGTPVFGDVVGRAYKIEDITFHDLMTNGSGDTCLPLLSYQDCVFGVGEGYAYGFCGKRIHSADVVYGVGGIFDCLDEFDPVGFTWHI